MKQRIIAVLIACAAVMVANPNAIRAQVGISANIATPNVDIQINSPSDFNQPLEPYGTWVDVGSYGRCWRPREVATDWQPYTVGHWEWTDAGWYWVSDEPWGWACFHYGSWNDDPRYGWVWIPGTEWAPAWVSWRYSDDYIGWAPCGPGRVVLAASFFTFCDVHHFQDHFRSRRDFQVNNTTIINRTKVVNNFSRRSIDIDGHQRTVFENRGPGVDSIQRATGHNFTPRPVRDVIHESRPPENMRRENNNNQPRDLRQDQQRPNEQPRRETTPAPTGREQPRNYQQPENRPPQREQTPPANQTPEQQNRDRVRPNEQPVQPIQRPQTPEQRTLPPTGRNEVQPAQPEHRDVAPARPQQEVPKPTPPAEQRREVPTPPQRPNTPAEQPLPPTGRNDVRPAQPQHPDVTPTRPPQEVPRATPPAERPAARPEQPVHPITPATPPRDDGHNRDGRDGNQ